MSPPDDAIALCSNTLPSSPVIRVLDRPQIQPDDPSLVVLEFEGIPCPRNPKPETRNPKHVASSPPVSSFFSVGGGGGLRIHSIDNQGATMNDHFLDDDPLNDTLNIANHCNLHYEHLFRF